VNNKTFLLVFLIFCQSKVTGFCDSAPELIAVGRISGTAKDASPQSKELEEGTASNQLGGFSAMDYSGQENLFWVLGDRGPADGAASYPCRMHLISLEPDLLSKTLRTQVIKTVLFKDQSGKSLLGALSAVPQETHERGIALDPEGIRLLQNGDFAISDEYGPAIDLFSASGIRKKSFSLPRWMDLTRESSLEKAQQGTMPNRGLEGLALSTNGECLVAAMQGPLIQDSFPKGKKRFGNHVRIVQADLTHGPESFHGMKQFLYPLTHIDNGISEILAVDSCRYLVLERDSRKGAASITKAIYLINIQEATDVANRESIPFGDLSDGIKAVHKKLAIDLLSPNFGWDAERAPEKPEGLAWGKRLPDGRRSLWVCFDNDFQSDVESLFFLFAIDDLD